MYRNKVTMSVIPGAKGVKHDLGHSVKVFLQRQGSSTNLWFCGGRDSDGAIVSVEMSEDDNYHSAHIRTSLGRESKTVFFHQTGAKRHHPESLSVESPRAAAAMLLTDFFGKSASIHPGAIAYMFNDHQSDTILSPFVYESETDTIRAVRENYCLLAFERSFDERRTDIDTMAKPFLPYFEKALNLGFHQHDREKGDDYCRRRLAWLAGAYFLEERMTAKKEIIVGVLQRNMEWPGLWTRDCS